MAVARQLVHGYTAFGPAIIQRCFWASLTRFHAPKQLVLISINDDRFKTPSLSRPAESSDLISLIRNFHHMRVFVP